MIALAFSAALAGVDAEIVPVETDSAAGVPAFALVGLPDRALNESRERIRAAIVNSGFGFPPGRLLVNLAPADRRKSGAAFDLAIALALLATDEQIRPASLRDYVVCGELALDGTLRAVCGVLAMTLAAKRAGFRRIIVPEANVAEAALVDGVDVYAVPTLADAVAATLGHGAKFRRRGATVLEVPDRAASGDFADVKGQASSVLNVAVRRDDERPLRKSLVDLERVVHQTARFGYLRTVLQESPDCLDMLPQKDQVFQHVEKCWSANAYEVRESALKLVECDFSLCVGVEPLANLVDIHARNAHTVGVHRDW